MLKEITHQQLQEEINSIISSGDPEYNIQLSKEDFEYLFASEEGIKPFFYKLEASDIEVAIAITQALSSIPNIKECSNSCTIHFAMHPEYNMSNFVDAMNIIHDAMPFDAAVIFGTCTNEQFAKDFIIITLFFAVDIMKMQKTEE